MTNKLNLEQAILEILKKNQNIKAREIVENLKSDYQIEIDKTSLNKILYGSLSSKLDVNDYKWSLKTNREVANQVKVPEVKNTLLSKLSAYYLDCLSKDTDTGVSVYASNIRLFQHRIFGTVLITQVIRTE